MAVATREDSRLDSLSRFSALQLTNLVEQPGREPYSGWYIGDPDTRWSDPAKDAYDNAIELLQKELTVDEYQAIWLRSHNSMQDVQKAVAGALEEYKTRAKGSKVRTWLASCSSRIMFYGSIFDMLSSHHPEYVSLAWGAMKFLFVAVLNHEELLIEISKAITKIADVLPRTELHLVLYPTARMQAAVALVYAKIIEFVALAIKWYKKGKVMHSISAIVKPFKLSFKPIIDDITERSRRVDELANAASKAEIRDLHVRIFGLNQNLVHLSEMVALQQQQQVLHNQSLLAFQNEYKQMFQKGQIEEIRSTIFLEDTPVPDESLDYCKSMRNRRRQKLPTQLPVQALSKLKSWISDPSSSMLLAQGQGVRTSSLDFAVDFLEAVMERDYPVLWALPSTTEDDKTASSFVGMLRSLISQALVLDSSVVSEGRNPVTIKHFKTATTVQQWLALLERCISNFPRLFLVLDIGLIETAAALEDSKNENFRAGDFIDELSELVRRRGKGGLKIVIASWKFTATTSLDAEEIFDQMHIVTDMGRKMNRLMRQPKYRSIFRKRNQEFSSRLRSTLQVVEEDSKTIDIAV